MAVLNVELPSELETDVKKLSRQVYRLAEQLKYFSINVDADNVTQEFAKTVASEAADGFGEALARQQTQIEQNAELIALKASEVEVDALGSEMSSLASELRLSAQSLTARVASVEGTLTGGVSKVTASGVTIAPDSVSITTNNFSVMTADGTEQMYIDSGGLAATRVTSPTVTPRYDGPAQLSVAPDGTPDGFLSFRTLEDAFNRLSHKYIPSEVTITITPGSTQHSFSGAARLQGVAGMPVKVLTGGAAATLAAKLMLVSCSARVEIEDAHFALGAEITDCACAAIRDSRIENGVSVAASRLIMEGVEINCDGVALSVSEASVAAIKNVSSSGSLTADASLVMISGNYPSGGTSATNNAQIISTGATAASAAAASASAATTGSYEAIASGAYLSGWTAGAVRQGYLSSGAITGAVWFDNAAFRAALTGKTASAAGLAIFRARGAGKISETQVYLSGITNQSASGEPGVYQNYGLIGSVACGDELICAIPAQAANDLASGAINALALITGETGVITGKSHSENYAEFAGADDAARKPRLYVSYA